MLKNIILIFGLIFISLVSIGQEGKMKVKPDWAIDGGGTYSLIGLAQRVELQLGVLAAFDKHQFKVAPLFLIWSSEAANNPKNISISGLALDYYHNLPTLNKNFELYFKYEMAFQFYNNKWDGTYYNSVINSYENYSDKSNEFFFGNTVAYGFTYKPVEKMFMRLDFGGGVYFSSIKGDIENYYGLANARYDFRGYDDFGFIIKSSVSIGYVL